MEKQKVSEPIQFERSEQSFTTTDSYSKQTFGNKKEVTATTTTTTEQSSYGSEPTIDETAGRRKRKTTKLTDEEKLV